MVLFLLRPSEFVINEMTRFFEYQLKFSLGSCRSLGFLSLGFLSLGLLSLGFLSFAGFLGFLSFAGFLSFVNFLSCVGFCRSLFPYSLFCNLFSLCC